VRFGSEMTLLAILMAEFVALWERRAMGMRKPPRLNLDAQAVKCCHDYSSFYASEKSARDPTALTRYRSYVQNLRPVIAAVLWTRWLHLERALELASRAGDLLSVAVVLRTMIEELSALLRLTECQLGLLNSESDEDLKVAHAFAALILPRLGQIADPTVTSHIPIHPRLLTQYHCLNDYVHPNFGSHILVLFPERSAAGHVFLDAAVRLYGCFFEMAWTHDKLPGTQLLYGDPGAQSWNHTKETFVRVTVSRCSAQLRSKGQPAVADHLGENLIEWIRVDPDQDLVQEVLQDLAASFSPLTETLQNSGLGGYSMIQEFLDSNVPGLPATPTEWIYLGLSRRAATAIEAVYPEGPPDYRADPANWARFMSQTLQLAMLLTELKLNMLRVSFVREANDGNCLAAIICMRSLVEHCAVRAFVIARCHRKWLASLKKAGGGTLPANEFAAFEAELATFLGGTRGTLEAGASWGSSWNKQRSARAINLTSAVKEGLESSDLLRAAYDFGSSVVHGRIFAGVELVPPRYLELQLPLLTKAINYVDAISNKDYAMDAAASVSTMLCDLSLFTKLSESRPMETAAILRKMLLVEGTRLQQGKDYFGDGTRTNPFWFPAGRNYFTSFYALCSTLGITPDVCTVGQLPDGRWIDKIVAEQKEYVFVINSPWTPGFGDAVSEQ
jgi:hypothetical protein